jgi:hypothetical protein
VNHQQAGRVQLVNGLAGHRRASIDNARPKTGVGQLACHHARVQLKPVKAVSV